MLQDDRTALKETMIAVEVFGRPASTFDPRTDTIVRVEARRLRARLSDYYRTDGRQAPIRIELPVGSYVPLIATREPEEAYDSTTRHARDLVERGEHYLRQPLSRQTLELAIERFDLALRESPRNAAALAGLGRAWHNLACAWYVAPAVGAEHAGEALRAALAIDPDQPVAHALMGAVQHQFEHDWASADRSFRRAVDLAPQQAFVHSAYGCHLYMHGALAASERALMLARRLDPQYVNARTHMVNLRIAQRRYADAQAELAALADLAPGNMAVEGLRGAIATYRGDARSAVEHYRRACAAMPDHAACHIALAGACAMAGDAAEADALHDATLQRHDAELLPTYTLAIYQARRGRHDAALDLLERAVRERDPYAVQIPLEPAFDALHGNDRWHAILDLLVRPKRPG